MEPDVNVDTIRALATYSAALIVIVGGGILLYATYGDSAAGNLLVMLGGFIGAALQFLFGQETSGRTARQVGAATYAATNGNSLGGKGDPLIGGH